MKTVKNKYYTVFNYEAYGKNHNMILRRGEKFKIVSEPNEKYYIVKKAGRGNHLEFLIEKEKIEEIN